MGKKNSYKAELKMLKEHRKKYLPAVMTLLNYHDNRDKQAEHIEFKDTVQKLILAELIDIGYLDPKVVVIDRYFESIDKVFFTLDYPLTPKGEIFYRNEVKAQQELVYKKRKIKVLIIAITAILISLLATLLIK